MTALDALTERVRGCFRDLPKDSPLDADVIEHMANEVMRTLYGIGGGRPAFMLPECWFAMSRVYALLMAAILAEASPAEIRKECRTLGKFIAEEAIELQRIRKEGASVG